MDRQSKIYLFSSISILGLSFLGYRTIRRGQSYDLLLEKISDLNVIDNQKINNVLNGVFHTSLDTTKGFAMLNETKKREVAEGINKALSGLTEDEDAVYSLFGSLQDKVAISQVSAYYKSKYNVSLLQKLKELFSTNEQATANKIINSKPDVRWLS